MNYYKRNKLNTENLKINASNIDPERLSEEVISQVSNYDLSMYM